MADSKSLLTKSPAEILAMFRKGAAIKHNPDAAAQLESTVALRADSTWTEAPSTPSEFVDPDSGLTVGELSIAARDIESKLIDGAITPDNVHHVAFVPHCIWRVLNEGNGKNQKTINRGGKAVKIHNQLVLAVYPRGAAGSPEHFMDYVIRPASTISAARRYASMMFGACGGDYNQLKCEAKVDESGYLRITHLHTMDGGKVAFRLGTGA